MVNKDIQVVNESDERVIVKAGAGLNWDEFVLYTINKGWWGIENMSLIPGSVGACPVQNVGAYGQDCRGVIFSVEAFDTKANEFITLSKKDCDFGFRSSIFNKVRDNRYIITNVNFSLSKVPKPCLSRESLRAALSDSLGSPQLQSLIREVVIKERTNGINLPIDPKYGCAGTFFRTAIVSYGDLFPIFIKTVFTLGPKVAVMMLGFTLKYRSKDGCKLPSKFLINTCGLANTRKNAVFLFG